MARIKLAKTTVDAANPKERDLELRDTTIDSHHLAEMLSARFPVSP